MVEIQCFVEGQQYSELDVPKEFIKKAYFNRTSNGLLTAKITGISHMVEQDEIRTFLFLPKGFHSSQIKDENEKKELAKLVYKTLKKYSNTTKLEEFEQSWLGKKDANVIDFSLIEWLLRDWQNFGFYRIQNRSYELNGKGKIDWRRTIKKTFPIFGTDDIIYPNLWTFKNNLSSDKLITEIHKSIIKDILDKYGWLYDIQKVHFIEDNKISDEQKVIFLKRKLNEVNAGRDIILLQNLITYLTRKESDSEHLTLATPYFYSIYEKILQEQFGHDRQLNKLVPKPYWILSGDSNKKYSRQIPDILIKTNNNDLVILDAKYYSVTEINEDSEILDASISRFPGWEAVVKQLYYNGSMEGIYNNIENIFIMPENISNKFRYIGYTGVANREDQFGIVLAYSINIKKILVDYLSNEKNLSLITDIISDAKIRKSQIIT